MNTPRNILLFLCLVTLINGNQILIDHTCTDLNQIPSEWIEKAKTDLHIAYQHTSHGSQLISGMNTLKEYPAFGDTYAWSEYEQEGHLDLDDQGIPGGCNDLSQGDKVDSNGDTPWVISTRELLDNPDNAHITTIMWSWCSINGHDAQRYVDNMEKLVAEYPNVQFVFMTGHAQGQGEDLTEHRVHYNNQLIRAHCRSRGRILFDFADIEAYDPDGTYFWDKDMRDNLAYDGGNWGVEWIADNKGSELDKLTTGEGVDGFSGCGSCAHSASPAESKINCVLKGKACWWLFARLAGWSKSDAVIKNMSNSSSVDIRSWVQKRILHIDNRGKNGTVSIYASNGKEVFSIFGTNINRISLDELPQGLYLAKIQIGMAVSNVKFTLR